MKSFLLKSRSFAITLVIVNLFFAGTAFAKSTTWIPAIGGVWTTAGNWSNGLPVAGDDIIINSNQSAAITAVPTISLTSLTVSGNCNLVGSASGNTITVTGTFSVSAGVALSLGTDGSSRLNITLNSACIGTIDGTVNIFSTGTSATFINNGSLTLGSTAIIANGTNASNFSLSATGILNVASTAGISTTAGTGSIRVTGTRTYTAGAQVVYNGTAAQVTGNGIPTTCDITVNNAAGVTLSAAYTGTGTLTMQNGTLDMADLALSVGSLTGSGNITNATGGVTARTISIGSDNTSPAAYTGIISNGTNTGGVSLTKTGTGTLTLSGLNTYSGATTISAGTLSVNTLANSGTSSSIGTGSTTPAISIGATGILKYTGAGNSSNRAIVLTASGGTIDASGAALVLSGGVTGNTFGLILTGTGSGEESGTIATTSGTVTKNGTGTWTFSAANSYTGLTTVSAGTFLYGINNALSTGGVTVSGGTFDISTFTDAVGTVTLSGGTIAGTTGVLTGTSYAVQSGSASAILGGTGALTKSTAGTVTLSGASTYSGGTSLTTGTLIVANTSGLGNTSGTVALTGGTLQLATDVSVNAYNVTLNGTATITSNRATAGAGITHTLGTFSIGAGDQLNITAGTNVSSGTAGLTMGATTLTAATPVFDVATGANLTLGALSGNFAFTKQNSGQLTLNTASARTSGTVTLNGGTMQLGIANALGTTGVPLTLTSGTLDLEIDVSVNAYPVTVNGTATISSNRATAGAGITHTLGTLSIGLADQLNVTAGTNVSSGTAGLTMGATTLTAATPIFDVATGANLTLGALSGNFAFTKQNSGQLTLNTASARTSGTVTLIAGTMKLGIVNALGTTGVPLQLNGGILDLSTDVSVNAYNTTVGGIAGVMPNRATSGAAIVHTLGTLTIGTGGELDVLFGSNVSSGTDSLKFGATTFTGATPLLEIGGNTGLTLGALSGNFAFTKHGDGVLVLKTASARTAGTFTVNSGPVIFGSSTAIGTSAVGIVLNQGTGLHLDIDVSVTPYPLTVNGLCAVLANRATVGPGILHTMGPLTIGSHLTVHYGDKVNDATGKLTFGAVTFYANSEFDVSAGTSILTLGALSGNFNVNKLGAGFMIMNTASPARTGGVLSIQEGIVQLGATNALGTTGASILMNGIVNGTCLLDLQTNTTINAYNVTITGGNAVINSNRSTAGAGITQVLGTLTIDAHQLDITKGANVTSGTSAVQFGDLTMTAAPTFNPSTADLIMTGTSTGAFKLTKIGAGTLQKTTTAWTLGGDFEIDAGTYDATTQNTTLLGNWINNGGTHTGSGASTFIFNGSTAQTIGGSSSTVFNAMTIDNTSGVSLGTNETVNAALTLNNGKLNIPTGNTLTIANGTPIGGSGFDATRQIATLVDYTSGAKGFVKVNNLATSSAYSLPVGDGVNYLPVTLTPTDVPANNSFNVCVFQGITANGEPNGTPFSTPQKNNCVDAVWTVNYNGPGTPTAAPVNMKVGWPASLEGVNFAGYSDVVLGIAHWDGPNWGVVVGTGDNTNNTATRTNITQFSPFAVGRIDPTGGVLSIKINYFNASKGNGFNTLNWQAACSSAQAIFEIERSVDGANFININSITATQARCASPFSYNDNTAPAGTVFYRIKIIDVDGKVSYSAIVKLSNQVKDIELSGIAPNPVMNIAQVKVNTVKKDVVNLVITSTDGKLVYRNSIQLQPGSSIINMDISNLPVGIYMIKGIFSDGQTNSIKFIKQ